MARGFESKDVEFQQAEAERRKTTNRVQSPPAHVIGPDVAVRCRTIELSLLRVKDELAKAARPVHRQMLERAITDLEQQLAALRPDDGR